MAKRIAESADSFEVRPPPSSLRLSILSPKSSRLSEKSQSERGR